MNKAFLPQDESFMRTALALADKVKGTTVPNPAVGAVVVADGSVVGSGATAPAGGPHAEKTALRKAGACARGATLYVTLEPCCHHGRTPPCVETIVRSGVRRVVAASRDPNPLVCGKGFGLLRKHGVEVNVGLLRAEATAINEDFFWSIRHGRTWVSLKLAMTLDGRIADSRGKSKWISGERSRAFVHDLRRRHAGIAVGRGTLLADDPLLTVRHVEGVSPARFVFSSTDSIPPSSRFVRTARQVRSIVVVGGGKVRTKTKRTDGVEVWATGEKSRAGRLGVALEMAFDEGIPSMFVEGGRELAAGFLECRMVNRLFLFYGNKILGNGQCGLELPPGLAVDRPLKLRDIAYRQLGEDMLVSGLPDWELVDGRGKGRG